MLWGDKPSLFPLLRPNPPPDYDNLIRREPVGVKCKQNRGRFVSQPCVVVVS